jgi:hypothetical protein
LPPEVRELANDALILAESEVSIPGGISPKFIERADYMQYNPATRRFEVAYSVPNRVTFDPAEIYPGGARPGISALERTGSSVADSPFHSWARFDWMPPRGMMALDVPQPTAAFAQSVTKGDVLVFTKSERVWRAYPSGAGLSASALRNAGFAAGTYADHPQLVFWVPRPGFIPVSTVSAPGFVALPVKRSQAEDPVTGDVALGLGDRRLVDTGKDYAVTGAGSGVHDLALGTASDPGGRWRFEKVEGSVYRLLNPDRGTALQLTNEWYGDSSSGVRVVVGSPIGWNSAQQRWTLESADDGALILRSAASPEYVLMVAPDGSLIAGDPGGASEWRVVPHTG